MSQYGQEGWIRLEKLLETDRASGFEAEGGKYTAVGIVAVESIFLLSAAVEVTSREIPSAPQIVIASAMRSRS
jgi:hypothetical protein